MNPEKVIPQNNEVKKKKIGHNCSNEKKCKEKKAKVQHAR